MSQMTLLRLKKYYSWYVRVIECLNIRWDTAEERINELKDRAEEIL